MNRRSPQFVVTVLTTGILSSVCTVIVIYWFVDPTLRSGRQIQTDGLFSLAILGLYLVAIIMAAATLWATLMGPKWITSQIKIMAQAELEDTKRDDVGRTTFYIAYVYGTLADIDAKFLDEAADFAKNAHRYLPENSALKTSALNNWVIFESRRGRNSAIAPEIVDAAQTLRRQYMADRDYEFATTYAMAVLTYAGDFPRPHDAVADAERLLSELLESDQAGKKQKDTARERLAKLHDLSLSPA